MKSRFFIFLTVLLSMLPVSARTLTPAEALERAIEHKPADVRHPMSANDINAYQLAYSSPSGSYYVFNRPTGGFIVVSGDDEIYALLAEIDSGEWDADALAPEAGLLLAEYDRQISAYAESTYPTAVESLMELYTRWTDIAPLVRTQWNQSRPYNILCPAINGSSCMTGCVATAMSQCVATIGYFKGNGYKFHNSTNINGQPVEFDYSTADFDFSKMADYYSGAESEEAIRQVASLMLACGLATNMNYGVYESGAPTESVPGALIDYFGYDRDHTRYYNRDHYSQAQWENMLYSELDAGRPVFYTGYNNSVGHAFVIDGYRKAGLFHVNWGWGGQSDGYFRLTALSPSQIGIGGGEGTDGFNSAQGMIHIIKPGDTPGITYSDMYGSIAASKDGGFDVYFRSAGRINVNVNLGAVIIDASGNRATTATFWTGHTISGNGSIYQNQYAHDFTQYALPAGDYRIYPAFQPSESDFVIANPVNGRNHYVLLTVDSNGQYHFSNSAGSVARSDIRVTGIVPGHDLRVGYSGQIGIYAVNNGGLDFSGTISGTLVDSDGNDCASFTTLKNTIAYGCNTIVYATVPAFDNNDELLQAGDYTIRFTDADGNRISDKCYPVAIKTGTPLESWRPNGTIQVINHSTISPTMCNGDMWPHTPFVDATQSQRNMELCIALYNAGSTAATKTYSVYQGTISPMYELLPISPFTVDAPFGAYEACYRKGYNQISCRRPIRVGVRREGLAYYPSSTVTGGVSASLDANEEAGEIVIVPSTVNIDGQQMKVSEIETEAFMNSDRLQIVELPATVTNIGANAFTYCIGLQQIIMHSAEPPLSLRNHIAPGLSAKTAIYVPAESYDKYLPLFDGLNPLYSIVESIESKDVECGDSETIVSLAVAPAHHAVNPEFIIEPVGETSDAAASVALHSVEPGIVRLAVTSRHKGSATFNIRPSHRSDDYATLHVVVPELTGIEDIPADNATIRAAYDLQGRPVSNPDNAPTEIIITVDSNGKATKTIGKKQ